MKHLARVGAIAAFVGAPLLLVATLLHPMSADPNDAVAAFTEYAADRLWVSSHLGQFLGIALLGVALLALGMAVEPGPGAAWARIGIFGTSASLAAAAALQAVDGIALKRMVDRWAAAADEARVHIFESAYAVRQIEIGLASLLSILFGVSIMAFAVAVLASRRFPKWLGWLGLLAGIGTTASGLVQAYTGFSALAMGIGMPANFLLLLWAISIGSFLWRTASLQGSGESPPEV